MSRSRAKSLRLLRAGAEREGLRVRPTSSFFDSSFDIAWRFRFPARHLPISCAAAFQCRHGTDQHSKRSIFVACHCATNFERPAAPASIISRARATSTPRSTSASSPSTFERAPRTLRGAGWGRFAACVAWARDMRFFGRIEEAHRCRLQGLDVGAPPSASCRFSASTRWTPRWKSSSRFPLDGVVPRMRSPFLGVQGKNNSENFTLGGAPALLRRFVPARRIRRCTCSRRGGASTCQRGFLSLGPAATMSNWFEDRLLQPPSFRRFSRRLQRRAKICRDGSAIDQAVVRRLIFQPADHPSKLPAARSPPSGCDSRAKCRDSAPRSVRRCCAG